LYGKGGGEEREREGAGARRGGGRGGGRRGRGRGGRRREAFISLLSKSHICPDRFPCGSIQSSAMVIPPLSAPILINSHKVNVFLVYIATCVQQKFPLFSTSSLGFGV